MEVTISISYALMNCWSIKLW